jgi:IclR family transcriptional regulator, KDG regulon repressor
LNIALPIKLQSLSIWKQPWRDVMRAVANAVRLIQKFEERPEWGVSDLARATGMDKAMTHRILRTLLREQWVEQNLASRLYSLGPALRDIASLQRSRPEVLKLAEPVLDDLVRRFNETVLLSSRHQLFNVVELIRECTREVRVVSEVGRRIPLHCGAAGKTWLAFDHPSLLERLLEAGLRVYTANTIASPEALKAELDEIRDRGWGFENEEYSAGVSGIGAPIWNSAGCITGSIAIRAPTTRLSRTAAAEMAPVLMQAAADVSARLGYPGKRD